MKVSKAYFNRFKKAFLYWQREFGLTQYEISFFQKYLKYSYSEIKIKEIGKIADVFLTTKISGLDKEADIGPEENAKHEAIHLLLYRLVWLGSARYIEQTDINEEWEAIVRRLEKVIK